MKVFVRIKPTGKFAHSTIQLGEDKKSIAINIAKNISSGYINNQVTNWSYNYNGVLYNASQEDVYSLCADNLVNQALNGYNCTLFTYGETGGGKTFTLTGPGHDFERRGIVPRAISQIFHDIKQREEFKIKLRVSYLEIYNESIHDLLLDETEEQQNLEVIDLGAVSSHVKGQRCIEADSEEDALHLLFKGDKNRTIGHHKLNRHSSRSHCIFTVYIESHSITESNTKYSLSRLNFVDLAGSERLKKTGSEGITRHETLYINKSLSFLEQTIVALADHQRNHIPYRQSKLTHILKDGIGGTAHTVMIANIWGEEEQLEETISTLRFASQAMQVPSKPEKMEFLDYSKMCQIQEKEINALRRELQMYDTLTNRGQVNYEQLSTTQITDIKEQVRKYINGELQEIDLVSVRQVQEIFRQFKLIAKPTQKNDEEIKPKAKHRDSIDRHSNKSNMEQQKETVESPINTNRVGSTDGQGFSVGAVNTPVKTNNPIVNSRKGKSGKRTKIVDGIKSNEVDLAPSGSIQPTTPRKDTATPHEADIQEDKSTPTSDTMTESQVFEIFKTKNATESVLELKVRKDTLRKKKNNANELAQQINIIKREMDEYQNEINKCKPINNADEVTEDGLPILEEETYILLKKRNEKKAEYRELWNNLEILKEEIEFENLKSAECRSEIIQQFNEWQKDLEGIRTPLGKQNTLEQSIYTSSNKHAIQTTIDSNNQEAKVFYNAYATVEQRKLFSNGSTLATKLARTRPFME